MPWTAQLARAGLLPDRLARLGARRRLLMAPDRAERASSGRGADRHAEALATPRLPAFWCPGELPSGLAGEAARVLGERRLAAAAHWPAWAGDLDAAEQEMLALVARRAGLGQGQTALLYGSSAAAELLAAASGARVEGREPGAERGQPEPATQDRVLVLEAFPDGVDPRAFLAAAADLLRPGGRLFVQLACHRRFSHWLSPAEADWLGLGAGALVPATDLLPLLCPQLALRDHWELSGEHYERTARAWRLRLDHWRAARAGNAADRALSAWRAALLAREAMFGARGGQEWWISHYALERGEP